MAVSEKGGLNISNRSNE